MRADSTLVIDSVTMRTCIPAIAIPVAVILIYLFVPGLKQQPWTALRIAGTVLAVIGFALVLTARVQLGQSFSVRPQAKGLVTHGLYSRIRNPMYVFVDVMFFGVILALNVHWILAVLVLLAIFQVRQAQREARLLQEKFGQTYLNYRKQTWL